METPLKRHKFILVFAVLLLPALALSLLERHRIKDEIDQAHALLEQITNPTAVHRIPCKFTVGLGETSSGKQAAYAAWLEDPKRESKYLFRIFASRSGSPIRSWRNTALGFPWTQDFQEARLEILPAGDPNIKRIPTGIHTRLFPVPTAAIAPPLPKERSMELYAPGMKIKANIQDGTHTEYGLLDGPIHYKELSIAFEIQASKLPLQMVGMNDPLVGTSNSYEGLDFFRLPGPPTFAETSIFFLILWTILCLLTALGFLVVHIIKKVFFRGAP